MTLKVAILLAVSGWQGFMTSYLQNRQKTKQHFQVLVKYDQKQYDNFMSMFKTIRQQNDISKFKLKNNQNKT